MTDNVITTGTAADGSFYLYSVGLTDHGRPELILLGVPDATAANAMAPLMVALLQRQVVAAGNRKPIENDETVSLQDLGVHVRLRTVEPRPDYPLTQVERHYGFPPPMLTQVEIEARNDA